MNTGKRVLIVEDENTLRLVLKKTFSRLGLRSDAVETVQKARELFKANTYLAAFLDVNLPDGSGLELLSWIKSNSVTCSCVIMTADATMDNAVRAVKKGAFEYIVKPFDLDEIEQIIERIRRQRQLAESTESKPVSPAKEVNKYEIIGQSPAAQKLYKKIGKAASSSFTVLITGESGTGKELVARNLHQFSDRSGGEFVAINCSAIPKELMESELFGYAKGAFTGADSDRKGLVETATGGTLFMDEIGEISPKTQAKFLRLIEEGKITPLGSRKAVSVDVRFIASTNRNLEEMVGKKLFREDLYHRINVIPIRVPSLRKREGDVQLLARYFVKRLGGGRRSISDAACEELAKHPWPGNVRQLQNAIKRAIVMFADDVLLPSHFGNADDETPKELERWVARCVQKKGKGLYRRVISQIEAEVIRQALEKCGYNKIKAARLLGINRNTLTKKVKEYSL